MTDTEPRLTRDQTAAALTEAGFPISSASLARLACHGGGPPFDTFNGRPGYRLASSLEWARGRAKPNRRRRPHA